MNILNKLKQIHLDHKAMNAVRRAFGDIELIATVNFDRCGYECTPFQSQIKVFNEDPSVAILKSVEAFHAEQHRSN